MNKRCFVENFVLFGVAVTMIAPIIILIIATFTSSDRVVYVMGPLTLQHIKFMIDDKVWIESAITSIIVAVSTSLLSVFLGMTSAMYVFFNPYAYISRALKYMQSILLVIPDVLVGIVMIFLFTNANIAFGRVTLIISHTTAFSSFSFLIILSRLQEMKKTVIDAASDLGASLPYISYKILIPFCRKSIITAIAVVLGMSIDDVVVSFFTSGSDTSTFTLSLFNGFKYMELLDVVAASTALVFVIIFMMTCIFIIVGSKNFKVKSIKGRNEKKL